MTLVITDSPSPEQEAVSLIIKPGETLTFHQAGILINNILERNMYLCTGEGLAAAQWWPPGIRRDSGSKAT